MYIHQHTLAGGLTKSRKNNWKKREEKKKKSYKLWLDILSIYFLFHSKYSKQNLPKYWMLLPISSLIGTSNLPLHPINQEHVVHISASCIAQYNTKVVLCIELLCGVGTRFAKGKCAARRGWCFAVDLALCSGSCTCLDVGVMASQRHSAIGGCFLHYVGTFSMA